MNNAVRRPTRQCLKGHTMDPNWDHCPKCRAEQNVQAKSSRHTVVGASGSRETRVGKKLNKGARQETKVMSPKGSSGYGDHVGVGETRSIVGIVITYTWHPEGELFPVREGKNFIGSGKASSDPSHPDCDIQIEQDARMSSEHALILCRHGIYEIFDQRSSNGTFVDGEMLVSNKSAELSDYAEIKTGSTLWTFVKIKEAGTRESKKSSTEYKAEPIPDPDPDDKPTGPR